MAETTVSGTLAQDGLWDGTTWSEAGGITIEESLGRVAGFRFTGFPTTSTHRSEFLSKSATVTVTLPSVGAAQVPATLELWVRRQRAPSAYATANPPPYIAGITPLSDILLGTATVSSSGAQDVEFEPTTTDLDSARHTGGGLLEDFTGFALHLHARTADGTALTVDQSETGTAATFDYTLDTRVFTGIEIERGRLAESRPDQCPVCGSESLREEWVWCGYHDRLECSLCADPDTDELDDVLDSQDELVGED